MDFKLFPLATSVAMLAACVPTTSEFTPKTPTSTNAEKLELITGTSPVQIRSIFFVPDQKQYLITYQSDAIADTELGAAQRRMCRYRKLTLDKVLSDKPLEVKYKSTPPPNAAALATLRNRSFSCR